MKYSPNNKGCAIFLLAPVVIMSILGAYTIVDEFMPMIVFLVIMIPLALLVAQGIFLLMMEFFLYRSIKKHGIVSEEARNYIQNGAIWKSLFEEYVIEEPKVEEVKPVKKRFKGEVNTVDDNQVHKKPDDKHHARKRNPHKRYRYNR